MALLSLLSISLFSCSGISIRKSSNGSISTNTSSSIESVDTSNASTSTSTSTSLDEDPYLEILDTPKKELVTDSGYKMQVTVTNSNADHIETTENETVKSYYSPSEVTLGKTLSDYSQENYLDWHYTPSVGEVPLLVIPIVIPSYEEEANEDNMNLIKKAFTGDDLNFESLASYYYQSSYGKLTFKTTITDYFVMSKDSSIKKKIKFDMSSGNVQTVCEEALEYMTNKYNLKLSDYDTDDDGCIDGAWFVYIGRTYDGTNEKNSDIYWAYTTTTQKVGTEEEPVLNSYGWAGIDFLDGTYVQAGLSKKNNPDSSGDAHVLIHETGHMLGLADYYSYGSDDYSPLGKIDMMDNNASDQNPYSKLMLGWITPYVVTGISATIELETSLSKDNVILISYDDKKYEFDNDGKLILNPFDEYVLVDYYSPNGLNANDYKSYDIKTVKTFGARIYHVDSRLLKFAQGEYNNFYHQYEVEMSLPSDPDDYLKYDGTDKIVQWYRVISNSDTGDYSEEAYKKIIDGIHGGFDEIRWISADGNKLDKSSDNTGRLFTTQSFSLSDYSSQFYNEKFDNEKDFSSVVTFAGLSNS